MLPITDSGMTASLKLVQYLIICRETGETPKFPANELFYNFVDDCSYAVSIADLTVFATTTEHCKDEAFNHTNGDAYSWKYFYPRLGKYLGVHVSSFPARNAALSEKPELIIITGPRGARMDAEGRVERCGARV